MNVTESYIVDGEEIAITNELKVCCDGGGGALGHPLEYMAMPVGGEVVCKYCDRRYMHTGNAKVENVRAVGMKLGADGQLETGSRAA